MIFAIIGTVIFVLVATILLIFVYGFYLPKFNKNNFSEVLFAPEEIIPHRKTTYADNDEEPKVAVVMCSSEKKQDNIRFDYKGAKDCTLFENLYETKSDCVWQCIGFGNCIRVCPPHAISIINGTAVINDACNGCGVCLDVCPKRLITLIPKSQKECVLCSCKEGASTCSKCAKTTDLTKYNKKDFTFWKKVYKLLNK